MDKVNDNSNSLLMSKSFWIWNRAGAIMDEARGDRKVNDAVSMVIVHFFLEGQFFGFRGSSGPLNVTCNATSTLTFLQLPETLALTSKGSFGFLGPPGPPGPPG